jgi:hypothetical protein
MIQSLQNTRQRYKLQCENQGDSRNKPEVSDYAFPELLSEVQKKSGLNSSMKYYKHNESLLSDSQIMNEPLKKVYHLQK